MHRPKAIIFDVNETLLDLAPMKAHIGKALNNQEQLIQLWFSTLLHYSLVETLTNQYHSFGEIGTAALMMVAQSHSIELSHEDAQSAVLKPLLSLPPHSDVVGGLVALSESGYRLATLTNSSAAGAQVQLNNAGISEYFEKRYSIEILQKYKPHPDTYCYAVNDLGLHPGEVLMVAAHAWDLIGAKNAGLQTAFVSRPGVSLYPIAQQPDYIVNEINELKSVLP